MKIIDRRISINYTKGRGGQRVLATVLHISQGSLGSMREWFNNPAAKVSAHYGIGLNGTIEQYVDEDDSAWHAGLKIRPTARIVLDRPGVNPNDITIGIEHEGYAHLPPTSQQLMSSAELVRDIHDRRGIPLDREHVLGHREIRADKECPGLIDPADVIALAKTAPNGSGAPQIGERRWSPYLREYIYLTGYVSDLEWKFVRESYLRTLGTAGTVRWSQMPTEKPEP